MPSTNTISKPINELEKMLDTNKDSTGKVLATFMDNLSQILDTDHSPQISFLKNKLQRFDQFQIINDETLVCSH